MKYKRNNTAIKAFGANLRAIRKRKKISQEELAFRTDMELSQIGRIERGVINTSISSVIAIAQALNIHPKELFNFEMESAEKFE